MKCELCKDRILDNNYGGKVKDKFGVFVCWNCLHEIPLEYWSESGVDVPAYRLGLEPMGRI